MMRAKQIKGSGPGKRQCGAVLLVVLVIVTVMTLGGVAAMRSTGVDTKIAISIRSKLNALSLAENALKVGERAVCSYLANSAVCTGAFVEDFDAINDDGLHIGRELVNISGVSDYTSVDSEAVSANQSYIIEYLDLLTPAGSSLSVGNNTSADLRYIFRITAYGQSTNGGVSVVQTLYAARR